jgi:hypothetical protein
VPFTLVGQDLERISHYEAGLQRALQSAYAMLEQRRARRAAAAVPACPPALDD